MKLDNDEALIRKEFKFNAPYFTPETRMLESWNRLESEIKVSCSSAASINFCINTFVKTLQTNTENE
jgi:hypothetical protein